MYDPSAGPSIDASDERFPIVRWGTVTVTFEAVVEPLPSEQVEAVVVFALYAGRFVVADVPRGWCTPSGHVEPGETPLEAALRETREEIGAELTDVREIGRYLWTTEEGRTTLVPTYVGTVTALGALPAGSESRGVRCVALEELPDCYWRWDVLLERMFRYAEQLG